MGAWPEQLTVHTLRALDLSAKTLAHQSIVFTRAVLGKGVTTATRENLIQQTAVTDPVWECNIVESEFLGQGKTQLKVVIDNALVETAFDCWQLGIYAIDPDIGEILYIISQASEKDHIPAITLMHQKLTRKFIAIHGNAASVELRMPDNMYVRHEELRPVKELAEEAQQMANNAQILANAALPATAQAVDSAKLGGLLPSAFATAAQGLKADVAVSNESTVGGVKTIRNVASLGGVVTRTGAIVITMPFGWTRSMMYIRIVGYSYSSLSGAWELIVGGYNWSDIQWAECSAKCATGNMLNDKVRFGFQNNKCCIVIGDITSDWSFSAISVEKVISGFNYQNLLGSGWAIEYSTNLAGIAFSGGTFYANTGSQTSIVHPTWINVVLQNGFLHRDAPLRYTKINGIVYFIGAIFPSQTFNPFSSIIIATLPAGFRPALRHRFGATIITPGGDGNFVFESNGAIVFELSLGQITINSYIEVAGIFPAEQ